MYVTDQKGGLLLPKKGAAWVQDEILILNLNGLGHLFKDR